MELIDERVERLIEWKVILPLKDISGIRKRFLLQNKYCYLQFYTEYKNVRSPSLRFKCNDELHLPITVTLNVYSECHDCFRSLIRHRLRYHDSNDRKISIISTDQQIWEHSCSSKLNYMVIFELIFYANTSRESRQGSLERIIDSGPLTKAERKKLEKVNKFNIDLQEDKYIQTASYINSNIPVRSNLAEDFSKLLKPGLDLDYDAVIKCGDSSIKSHKLVLSTRSKVFRMMFQSGMRESQTGIVKIENIDEDLLEDFIRYLYTDEMPELTYEKAKALYCVGHMYEVESLLLRCVEYLQESLSRENTYELYNLANSRLEPVLKDAVKTYCLENKIKAPFVPVML